MLVHNIQRMKLFLVAHRRVIAFVALCTVIGAVATGLAGCGLQERSSTLEQRQREQVDQASLAQLERSITPAPREIVIPTGNGKEAITIKDVPASSVKARTENKEASNSSASGNSEDSETFPMFVKIIGLAVGMAALVGAFWLLRRSSVALDAAWQKTDKMIASRLKTISALKGEATDPAKVASYTAEESRLNALRAEAAR